MPRSNEAELVDAIGSLVNGRTITKVRYMSRKETAEQGWMRRPLVLVLDNGMQLYASRDDEGNDAGAMFAQDNNDKQYCFGVL